MIKITFKKWSWVIWTSVTTKNNKQTKTKLKLTCEVWWVSQFKILKLLQISTVWPESSRLFVCSLHSLNLSIHGRWQQGASLQLLTAAPSLLLHTPPINTLHILLLHQDESQRILQIIFTTNASGARLLLGSEWSSEFYTFMHDVDKDMKLSSLSFGQTRTLVMS